MLRFEASILAHRLCSYGHATPASVHTQLEPHALAAKARATIAWLARCLRMRRQAGRPYYITCATHVFTTVGHKGKGSAISCPDFFGEPRSVSMGHPPRPQSKAGTLNWARDSVMESFWSGGCCQNSGSCSVLFQLSTQLSANRACGPVHLASQLV